MHSPCQGIPIPSLLGSCHGDLSSIPGSAIDLLGDIPQAALLLWTSVSSAVKWEQ